MRSLLALLLLVPACAAAEGDTMKSPSGEGPIILELFTSQGCSSCPPADKLLSKLTAEGQLGGKQLLGLSFHVDYWNDLGWNDPYSLPAWTERQHAYARALNDARVYTPELVVGGAAGMVGSNVTAVSGAIAKAERPALLAAKATWSKDAVEITTTAPASADVLVAIYETGRTNKVPRGENSGTTSAHKNIVRRLERVAVAGKSGTLKLPLDAGWSNVAAVVFAQRPDKKIVASALVPRT
ncbi:MAG: DUF1223 domain-containing protein [Myxococcota bacterium]|nr:DUF1223 domain-containing protein [Deltaproteobacteria bacterium]MDQ3340939.1 DUF1223 domain-containing protein [Myxococcota bacterium]